MSESWMVIWRSEVQFKNQFTKEVCSVPGLWTLLFSHCSSKNLDHFSTSSEAKLVFSVPYCILTSAWAILYWIYTSSLAVLNLILVCKVNWDWNLTLCQIIDVGLMAAVWKEIIIISPDMWFDVTWCVCVPFICVVVVTVWETWMWTRSYYWTD